MKDFLFREKFPFSIFEKFGEISFRIVVLYYALIASRVNEIVDDFDDKRVSWLFHESDFIFEILLIFDSVRFKGFLWNFDG